VRNIGRGRKFGLHLVLAHQHLHQLKEKDPEVYYSTLTNARVKAVFGGLIDEDLDILAKELYTGEFDPDQIKDEIWQTKFRPVETTRTIRSMSISEGSGESYGEAISAGEVSHVSLSSGEVYIPGSGLWNSPTLQNTSTGSASGYARSSGSSKSSGRSSSTSYGESTANVPWYEYHEFSELSSRTFRSLEEQLYIKKAQMKRQAGQHAAILVPDAPVQVVKTPSIKEHAVTESQRQEFKRAAIENAGCFKSPEAAGCEIAGLETRLLAEVEPIIVADPIKASTAKTRKSKIQAEKLKKTVFDNIDINPIGRE
jgi:hypothetical protein